MDVDAEKAAVVAMSAAGELTAHPFAEMFPMVPDAELVDLAAAIARDGLLDRIVVFNRQILDGRNRYRAITEALQRPLTVEDLEVFAGTEEQALDFVESKNVNRRHLSVSQRAMIAADFMAARGLSGRTEAKKVADKFGISHMSVAQAMAVREKAAPHIAKMVESGELAVHAARRVAQMPKAAQKRLKTAEDVNTKAKEAQGPTVSVALIARHVAALAQFDPAELVAHLVELDAALQQLVVVTAKINEAAGKQTGSAAA